MRVGNLYTLGGKYKTSTALRLLAARLMRRHLLLLGIKKLSFSMRDPVENFKHIWRSVFEPLGEIFIHPLSGRLFCDFEVKLTKQSQTMEQFKTFFLSQRTKYEPHYSSTMPGAFDTA
jgi:hypothetical protein